ncbi:MAG: YfhO family protein, partial [Candidatus Omnitrophica bacterium]|nr:YfhO family protein [Candidatus Omnitrophota bacterium]
MNQRQWIWALLLLAAVPILFFHESLFTDKVLSQADVLLALSPWDAVAPPNFLPSNWLLMDQTLQFFPWLSFARESLRRGQIPLWNPYNYSGSPLLANGQSAVFSPFYLLFYVFPFLKMFSVVACLRLFLAGLFMVLFLRSLGVSLWGSLLSALSYQTCGFLIVNLNYPHSNPASLLPLLFWCTERLCQKPSSKRIVLLSFALWLQFLSGHLVTAVVQTLVVFVYGAYRSKRAFPTLRSLLLATFLGVSASAFILFPTLEYALLSHARSYRLTEQAPFFPQEADLKSILAIFFPMLYGTPLRFNSVGPRNFSELNSGFTGLVVLVFALTAIFGGGKGKRIRFFLGMTLIAFAAAYHLPILVTCLDRTGLLRLYRPSSWLLFSAFALSVLAGVGLDQFFSFEQKKSPLFRWILLAQMLFIGVCGLAIALTHQHLFPTLSPATLSLSLRLSLGVLGVLLILYFSWSRGLLRPMVLKGGILLLVILEHFLFGFRYNPTLKPEHLFPKPPAIQFLQSDRDPNPFRILSLGKVFFPNTGMRYHFQEVRGYDAVEYGPYMHYLEKLGPLPFSHSFFQLHRFPYYNSPLIDLLNVKYILSNDPLPGDFLRLVYDGEIKIYQNLRTFPRTYLFEDYEVAPDVEKQLDRLVDKAFDVRKRVLLEASPRLSEKTAKQWEVHWLSYEPNRLSVEVTLDGSGILFLSEVDYPGWKAYLDG